MPQAEVTTGRDDSSVLIERLHVDRELFLRLVLNPDIREVITGEGFKVSERFMGHLETSVKKVRTFINDQVHVLEIKKEHDGTSRSNESGNASVDW